MPSITVRLSEAERCELEYHAQGDISKYARAALFGDAQRDAENAENIQWIVSRMVELSEDQAVLRALVRKLADDVHEAPLPQPQPIAAPAQDNSRLDRLEGMLLELLLMLRGRASDTEKKSITAEVARLKLPVHGDEPYKPMVATGVKPVERRPQADAEGQDPPARENRNQGGRLRKWLG